MAALVLVRAGVADAAANGDESTMAREIADDINHERAARHLPAIPVDADYSAGAQRVAESNRDRPCHACHSTDHPSGEVVWWGSDYPSSGSPIWWMGSPPHRALLLAPNATRLGVGVACNGTEHDAVAWIETQAEAQNAPATPVATKAGTGSRCHGLAHTSTTGSPHAATSTTSGRAAAASVTTTRGTATTATTRSSAGHQTTTSLELPTSRGTRPPNPGSGSSEVAPRLAFRSVAGSRALTATGSNAVGGFGTSLLLGTFIGALALGRATRKRS